MTSRRDGTALFAPNVASWSRAPRLKVATAASGLAAAIKTVIVFLGTRGLLSRATAGRLVQWLGLRST